MDKYDALFIRAVKSHSNDFRVKRLYKKFYCAEYKASHLALVLTSIVERYNMATPTKMVTAFNPENEWMYGQPGVEYYDKVISIMMNFIFSTPISKIEGFPRSAYYRNTQKGK